MSSNSNGTPNKNINIPTRSSGNIVEFNFPPKLIKYFRKMRRLSIERQIEYAGNILIYTTPTGRGIRYLESEASTSQSFTQVNPPGTFFQNFISWHSHPHPIVKNDYEIAGYLPRSYPEVDKNAFSPPSTGDFELYIKNWPNMQVHFILDRYGYYVVDFTRDVNMNQAYINRLLKKCEDFRTKLEADLHRERRQFLIGSTYKGIRFFHCDVKDDRTLNEWKSFINKRYADAFRGEAIRCTFYTYRDNEHPIIHINNQQLVHATGGGVPASNLWRPMPFTNARRAPSVNRHEPPPLPTPVYVGINIFKRSPNNNVFHNASNVLPNSRRNIPTNVNPGLPSIMTNELRARSSDPNYDRRIKKNAANKAAQNLMKRRAGFASLLSIGVRRPSPGNNGPKPPPKSGRISLGRRR
jgi:hypothetical protein